MKRLAIFYLLMLYTGMSLAQEDCHTHFDISYANDKLAKHQLDLYLPERKGFPIVIFVHGGSLLGGDRKDKPYPQMGCKFAGNGIGVVIPSYRLGPESKWPSQPDDIAMVVKWTSENIIKYGGDPNRIFLAGHSSGALLSALLCLDRQYLNKVGLTPTIITGGLIMGTQLIHEVPSGFSTNQLKSMFQADTYLSIFNTAEGFNSASPMRQLRKDAPKLLFIIAEEEQFQPPILEQTLMFIKKADEINAETSFAVIPNRTHMGNIEKTIEPNDQTFQEMSKFITTSKLPERPVALLQIKEVLDRFFQRQVNPADFVDVPGLIINKSPQVLFGRKETMNYLNSWYDECETVTFTIGEMNIRNDLAYVWGTYVGRTGSCSGNFMLTFAPQENVWKMKRLMIASNVR